MLKARQVYRLRDLRKLRRAGKMPTLEHLLALMEQWHKDHLQAGLTWTTPPTAVSSPSLDRTENLPTPSGGTADESTVEMANGCRGEVGQSPILAD